LKFTTRKFGKILTMKLITLLFMTLSAAQPTPPSSNKTVHQFTVTDIDGQAFDLSNLKGKKVMIVNVASKCGLTPQYEKLQALYETYGPNKFVILGFPANNFLWQEPGTNQDIKSFCSTKYDVTFPMMSKISVKGKDKHPLYKFLTTKSENGLSDEGVSWNFQKFLIDENGELVKVISPRTQPDDKVVTDWLNQ